MENHNKLINTALATFGSAAMFLTSGCESKIQSSNGNKDIQTKQEVINVDLANINLELARNNFDIEGKPKTNNNEINLRILDARRDTQNQVVPERKDFRIELQDESFGQGRRSIPIGANLFYTGKNGKQEKYFIDINKICESQQNQKAKPKSINSKISVAAEVDVKKQQIVCEFDPKQYIVKDINKIPFEDEVVYQLSKTPKEVIIGGGVAGIVIAITLSHALIASVNNKSNKSILEDNENIAGDLKNEQTNASGDGDQKLLNSQNQKALPKAKIPNLTQITFEDLAKAAHPENSSLMSSMQEIAAIHVLDKSMEHENYVSTQEKEAIVNLIDKLKPYIIAFYKEEFDIELGNIDLTSGFNFAYSKEKNTVGSVYITGKIANNVITFNQKFFENLLQLKEKDIKSLGFGKREDFLNILLYDAISHEYHHKLFNLDSRMETKTSWNPAGRFISTAKREGFVDYMSQKCTNSIFTKLYNWEQHPNLIFHFKQEMAKHEHEDYKGYVRDIDTYLNQLAVSLCKSEYDHFMNPEYLINSRKLVDKLFASFFLSGDRAILDLAKSLSMNNILEI